MDTPVSSQLACPKCGALVIPTDIFCSRCGTRLPDAGNPVSIGKQIWIYFVALALPPFGIVWTFRFFRSPNRQQRIVGWVAFVLTIVSIILTVWLTMGFLQGLQSQLNSVGNYSNLGL